MPSTDEAQRGGGAAVTVTPYRDGPYLLRGSFVLLDQDGNEIPARRRIVALCRCGRSSIRPFCDGTHRTIGFSSASGPVDEAAVDDGPVAAGAAREGRR
jgi:CDGSH-type Zn-finger protein